MLLPMRSGSDADRLAADDADKKSKKTRGAGVLQRPALSVH